MASSFWRKHNLTIRILPLIAAVLILKSIFIVAEWQPLPLTALVTAIVSANVFLLGFLISGSLPDYKEAERLPSEIAAVLDTLTDEALILRMTKPDESAPEDLLKRLRGLVAKIKNWFQKKESTGDVMEEIRGLNNAFVAFEPLTQPNFIVRLKQEQQNLRRHILRVRTIREVTFVVTAYAIGESFTTFTVLILLLTDMSGLLQSLLFTGGISFLVIYMIALVKDLDNPFHYHAGRHGEDEVDIAPLEVVERKIKKELA